MRMSSSAILQLPASFLGLPSKVYRGHTERGPRKGEVIGGAPRLWRAQLSAVLRAETGILGSLARARAPRPQARDPSAEEAGSGGGETAGPGGSGADPRT